VLLDAAADDPAFDPERTSGYVHDVLAVADAIWRRQPPSADQPGASVLRTWASQITASRLLGVTRIGVLDVLNRANPDEARVVLRVTVRVRMRRANWVDARTATLDTRWVLARSGEAWQVVEIEPYSGEAPTRSFVARPSDDLERLHESALTELARADAPATAVNALISSEAPAHQALLDLSVVDGRYAPALLEAALNHILEAWETATTGSHEPLEAVADQAAIAHLLHSHRDNRDFSVIVDDLGLRDWRVLKLGADAEPPTVVVGLTIHGVIYRTTETGTIIPGDQTTPRDHHLWWALSITDNAATQWRLTQVVRPVRHNG